MANLLRRLYDAALRHRMAVCLGLGFLLLLPGLSAGFYLDDLWHQALLEAHEEGQDGRSTLDLCLGLWSWDTSLPGRSYLEAGSPYRLTWFADLDVDVRFFRPLSAWTLLVNNRFGGLEPFSYHVTSLAFWLLFAAAALELHRRLLPAKGARPVLLLAGLLFVLSDAHVINVVWVGHRHGILDALLSVVSLLYYDRFRHRGGLRNLLLSLAFFALALTAGETALLTLVWIAAYEAFLTHDPIRLRTACAAPFAALAAVYLFFYVNAGYGAHSSSWYLNPLERPLDFLHAAFTQRLPGYLMGALTLIPGELFQADSPLVTAGGMILILITIPVLIPSLRWRPEARFAGASALGSMLCLCVVPPFSYKLIFPSVAVSLLLAIGVTDTVRKLRLPSSQKSGAIPRLGRAMLLGATGLAVLMHGVAAPVLGNYLLRNFVHVSSPETRQALWRGIEWPEEREDASVYLINAPGSWTALFLPYEDHYVRGTWVGDYIPISFRNMDFELTRLDANTVRLRSPQGFLAGYFAQGLAAMLRRDPALRAGEDFIRDGFTVVVAESRNGIPTGLLVRFPRDLDDERVYLLAYDGTRTRRIRPPQVGGTLSMQVANP